MKKKLSVLKAQEEISESVQDQSMQDDDLDSDDDPTSNSTSIMVQTKKPKKSGGFQSMGLSYPVLKGVLKKGYKVPTPIQRKAIPVIMEGKDIVAMARTGSGKTGAFLIPMFEKLKARTSKVGARALILSPTRELALQTLKFTKELGRWTGLKSIAVLGGEKMEDQFSAVHENPDIVVATPGRFLHLVMEMDLKLSSVEYIVFDEADRLFEMGFQEQLEEVIRRLPEHRQTLMFSATLPKVLLEFVRAGLTEPELIRLDVEQKLSENLKTTYLCCRSLDKPAILLHLLKNVVKLKEELTVVFLATRHHVEYLKDILASASIPCSYVYSALDQTARKLHVSQFRSKKVGVLLVTDLAARGIDIPLLDNAINYNFPCKPKLFVHRVGRVARAGRSGHAYSLVGPDEAPYLLDLHLFLGKSVTFADSDSKNNDGICGTVPQTSIDEENESLRSYHETSADLRSMVKVCDNAYKNYLKSRTGPSSESIKRVKNSKLFTGKIHPLFSKSNDKSDNERNDFLATMKTYRPNTTIFEIGATAKNQASVIMRNKRAYHDVIERNRSLNLEQNLQPLLNEEVVQTQTMTAASENEIQGAFSSVIVRDSKAEKTSKKDKKKADFKDHENYLCHISKEHYSEIGLGVSSSFEQNASKAVLDFTGDDDDMQKKMEKAWHWDRKRKRFTKDDGSENTKKMKTESGVWISKSYKTDIYKKWKDSSKISYQNEIGSEDEEDNVNKKRNWKGLKGGGKNKKSGDFGNQRPDKREMKSAEEILKQRKKKARQVAHQKRKHAQKNKGHGGGGRGGFKKGMGRRKK